MFQLGEDIVEYGYVFNDKLKKRVAARGIIFNNKNELLMVYCAHYNDYTFPGGKVEDDEDITDALKRECVEEVGAIVSNVKPFLRIVEHRGIIVDNANILESQYFLCDLIDTTTPNLMDYEKEYGYEARWVSIKDVIFHNEETLKNIELNNAYTGVVVRELRLLNYLLENINSIK